MNPHAQIWFATDGTFLIPDGLAASMRMGLDSLNKGWFPTNVVLCNVKELKFRYDQDVLYMDRIRVMPAVLAVTIHANNFGIASDYESTAVMRAKWHSHINWRATMRELLEVLKSQNAVKLCGYDGPESPC